MLHLQFLVLIYILCKTNVIRLMTSHKYVSCRILINLKVQKEANIGVYIQIIHCNIGKNNRSGCFEIAGISCLIVSTKQCFNSKHLLRTRVHKFTLKTYVQLLRLEISNECINKFRINQPIYDGSFRQRCFLSEWVIVV